MATAARMIKQMEVEQYKGGNEYLDAIRDGESIFIVNASEGRIPMIADTAEDAIEQYLNRFAEDRQAA